VRAHNGSVSRVESDSGAVAANLSKSVTVPIMLSPNAKSKCVDRRGRRSYHHPSGSIRCSMSCWSRRPLRPDTTQPELRGECTTYTGAG